MNQLQVQIKNEHFKAAYDFLLNCPLELALKSTYPEAYIIIGAKKVVFIENPKQDKDAIIYSISDNYTVKLVEEKIKLSKSGYGVEYMTVTLTEMSTQENYLLTEPQDDHVEKSTLPADLFT